MSKELQSLIIKIDKSHWEKEKERKQINRCIDVIKERELKAQKYDDLNNANPSEALECLERIDKEYLTIESKDFDNCFNTIKQVLLKAQEPKQYLKWEDLEFNIEKQMMTVLLNGTEYTLIVGHNVHIDKLAFLKNGEINYYFLEADKQFFNDLHLERVEE